MIVEQAWTPAQFAMPLGLKDRFEAATGARLVEGYGLTESSGVVSTNPYEGLNKAGTIGPPIPDPAPTKRSFPPGLRAV